MKKIAALFFLFLFLVSIKNPNYKIQTVFQENDIENIAPLLCHISVKENKLTTNTIQDHFIEGEIVSMKPQMSPIYAHQLKELETYYMQGNSLQVELSRFKQKYLELMDRKGFSHDANLFLVYGIPIKEMVVNCDQNSTHKWDMIADKVIIRAD